MSDQTPEFLFLSINEVCNLRCQHCNYWRTKQPSLGIISLARQSEILAEFAELSPHGKVVICGGEPMLDVGPYFHICEVSRSLGLRTLSVINGTMIVTNSDADKVLAIGPDEISISLDGHTEELHDRMRGRKGAFVQATNALKLLLQTRSKAVQRHTPDRNLKIYAMGLLTKSTYLHLDEFYGLVLNKLGADKLKLNVLQPSFLHTRIVQEKDNDDFFAAESQVDADVLAASLTACNEKYQLHFNPNWMKQVVSYFRNLYGRPDLAKGWKGKFTTDEHICNSPERNIMVNLDGRASLCFSNEFPSARLLRSGDMKHFWENNLELKRRMGTCNALCGISHSVRREHSTLPVLS
jgi:MoaA/NifB/PqqE/SkfB family radical SAM enzyme